MIPYTLVRSSRKTISIVIRPNGEVEVRCPKHCSRREAEQFLASKEVWLRKHLEVIGQRQKLPMLSEAERKALAEQASGILPAKVRHFAQLIGVSCGRITIRSQRTRWGSCSAKGNLSFNCLLMLCPEPVQDYVVIHELCHRKEMNHSALFWAEVEKILPDYPIRRKWLKEHGSEIIGRL